MFLFLSHTKLDVYKVTKELVLLNYKITRLFPSDEKFAMTQQIRRAALSVHLNVAEGCSRRSMAERKRFFEISRGSLIEVDTALDIALELDYVTISQLSLLEENICRTFQLLTKMITAQ